MTHRSATADPRRPDDATDSPEHVIVTLLNDAHIYR